MYIYDYSSSLINSEEKQEEDVALRSITVMATAIIATTAAEALSSFAKSFGESLGRTLGTAVGEAIANFLGLGNKNNSISKEEMAKLLDEYAQYIVNQISLKIDISNLNILNARVAAIASDLGLLIKTNDFQRIDEIIADTNSLFFEILAVKTPDNEKSLRSVILGSATICGTLIISLVSAKTGHLFSDSPDSIESPQLLEKARKNVLIEMRYRTDMIQKRIQEILMDVQNDFALKVGDVTEREVKKFCYLPDLPRFPGNTDIPDMPRQYEITIMRMSVMMDGKLYTADSGDCDTNINHIPKLREKVNQERFKNQTDYEEQFGNIYTQILNSLTQMASQAEQHVYADHYLVER